MDFKNRFFGILVVVLVVTGVASALAMFPPQEPLDNITDTTTTPNSRPELQAELEYNGVHITYLNYAGFKIKYQDTVVYLDPLWTQIMDGPEIENGSYIVLTHAHLTHCNPVAISAISDDATITIGSPDVANLTDTADNKRHLTPDYVVRPGDFLEFDAVRFEFVPMYNIDPSRVWAHPPDTDDFGVIVEINGVRIYDASDTDRIPEMAEIDTDIALLPVSGYAEMSYEEAADAVEDLKILSDLKFAIPMHWRSYTGNIFNAYDFYELANTTVVILESLLESIPPSSSIP